ncbi:MAG TPA: T9SS type A sorting domain-containing protein [Bacteroidia bacterium]|nr:T9SS type A sorting domain-containing protein [Bacteroidia bacterium]
MPSKCLYVTLIILLSCNFLQAQRGNVWCFGDSAALDFNNLSNPLATNSSVVSRGSCVSIADTSGDVLFYANTDAKEAGSISGLVWNRNHELMISGDSVAGSGWYQEMVIVSNPADDSSYYIFSVGVTYQFGLMYSIVDMRGDGGLGAVTQKNVQLLNFLMVDCILAIKHGNGRDWWVIVRPSPIGSTPNNSWNIFLIDPNGSTAMPVQNIGSLSNTNSGTWTFNSETNKLSFINVLGIVEIFDFDRCSGLISNATTIESQLSLPPYPIYWISEFSPSGQYLYLSSSTSTISKLWQYDTWAPNILASKTLIWQTALPPYTAGALKRGPDNKIYMSCAWIDSSGNYNYPYDSSMYYNENMYLSVINSPDSAGLACDFQPWSFYLGGKRTYWGLPNNPDYELGPLVGSPCDTLVGISETYPTIINPQFNIFYHPEWQSAFINASNLTGTKGTLEIFDMQGKMVHQEDIEIVNGYYTRNFNMIGMADGMYFVNLISSGQRLSGKLVKY